MLRNRVCKNAGLALMGLVAGIALTLVLGFARDHKEDEKDILPRNTFGDLRIVTVPLERSDRNKGIVVCKGDMPIIAIYTNDSNEVDRFVINGAKSGKLAFGGLTRSGISEFGVYGNEVRDGVRTLVLSMVASDKPGVWHKVRYTPTVAVYDKGKLTRYRAVGEVYHDLDFDGQFDAKEIWDDKSVVISQSIIIKGEWRELGRLDNSGQFNKRAGGFDPENLSAYTQEIDGGKKTYFDFVPSKGWRERSQLMQSSTAKTGTWNEGHHEFFP